jgi:hypothetical protein
LLIACKKDKRGLLRDKWRKKERGVLIGTDCLAFFA